MLRLSGTLCLCVALGAAQPRNLNECGNKVVAKATQYFDILGRASLRPDMAAAMAQSAAALRPIGLDLHSKPPGGQVRIGKKYFPVNPTSWAHYEETGGKVWMDLVGFENTDEVRAILEGATQWRFGSRTGDSFALVTYQREAGEDVVAAGLRLNRYLLNVGLALPFNVAYDGQNATASLEQLQEISNKIDGLAAMIECFTRLAISPDYKTWVPPALPTEADERAKRMASFARLWAEVKFNFVFLPQRPNIDWDGVLDLFMPRVAAAKDETEYVQILREAVALLGDGHTWVYPEGDKAGYAPPVRIEPLGDALIVMEAAPSTGLTPGMELIEVEGMPVREKLARDVYPYTSASTRQGLEVQGLREIFRGPSGTAVETVFTDLDGRRIPTTLVRQGYLPQKPEAEYKDLPGDISYLAINTFAMDAGVKALDANLDRILKAKALILDVRENGGGNSSNGSAVISRLIDTTLPADRLLRFRARTYKASERAERRPADEWYQSDIGSIEPSATRHFLGPVIALIGPKTGSAAEGFAVELAASKRAMLVGTPTNGSTGQSLRFSVAGATVAICTEWYTFPDGTEFVGVGIQPDVRVAPTRRDVADEKDPVLDAAVQILARGRPH
ncbi:putative C-terminal processing peptidase [Candidatus Sulfopaludibacter sp. SbA3]|nr:putative C-terminal processing peptidase [Candidatus Sulfopaludibacter sp. SbA3]